MDSQCDLLTNSTVRMMAYIRRCDGCTHKTLVSRYGDATAGYMHLVNLCKDGYLGCQRPDGSYTNFKDGNYNGCDQDQFFATDLGQAYLDNRFRQQWHWMFPVVVSVVSLIISIVK